MSKAAFSILIFSFYLFFLGLTLLVAPNFLLGLLGFETTTEIWIRVLGLVVSTLGIYYFFSARYEQTGFFRATIIVRTFFFVILCYMTFFYEQHFVLALFGAVDLIAAIWTYISLKNAK